MASSDFRINRQIRARQVRLISDDNGNIGVVSLSEALIMAEERGLDLVEVAPNADPPVCRIMDFGKFRYEKQRRERKARKQQKTVDVKEIQVRPKTDDFHLSIKVRDARRWLEEGIKVRVRIRFRGREREFPEIGMDRMQAIIAQLGDVSVVEQPPKMDGGNMLMVLSPQNEKKK